MFSIISSSFLLQIFSSKCFTVASYSSFLKASSDSGTGFAPPCVFKISYFFIRLNYTITILNLQLITALICVEFPPLPSWNSFYKRQQVHLETFDLQPET